MDICRICGWQGEGQQYDVKEMMYGTGEVFRYFVCQSCGCLQIRDFPKDPGRYYEKDSYYSYEMPEDVKNIAPTEEKVRVLDVGCGAGKWLHKLAKQGYGNLTGCDPYIPEEFHYQNGIHIYKRTIHEMDGEFDWIFFNDSFEHMPDPHEVMESVRRLLAERGICYIKIPVFPNLAFDLFGTSWYQWDAPRHFFLYSKESLSCLATQHDMQIVKVEYDSNVSQIVRSFLYTKGIALGYQSDEVAMQYFTLEQLKELHKEVEEANVKEYGDHACFFLQRRSGCL